MGRLVLGLKNVGTESDIRDKQNWRQLDVGTSVSELKMAFI
jgi:hypothetical protein